MKIQLLFSFHTTGLQDQDPDYLSSMVINNEIMPYTFLIDFNFILWDVDNNMTFTFTIFA